MVCIIKSTVASASMAATASRDQLEALGPDDVNAQNFAVALVGHHFDEALVVSQDSGAAVAGERETAHLHLVALRARLGLGEPHAADARFGVGAAGDAILVDGDGRFAGHVRHRDHALARSHVGQLRRARYHSPIA